MITNSTGQIGIELFWYPERSLTWTKAIVVVEADSVFLFFQKWLYRLKIKIYLLLEPEVFNFLSFQGLKDFNPFSLNVYIFGHYLTFIETNKVCPNHLPIVKNSNGYLMQNYFDSDLIWP